VNQLNRGTVIKVSDVEIKRVNMSRVSGDVISDVSGVVGKKMKNTLKKGYPFKTRSVGPVPIIYKGDTVKLIADNGKLRIVTLGIAKIDGVRGEQIKVMNLTSKKIITGVVVDTQTIAVVF